MKRIVLRSTLLFGTIGALGALLTQACDHQADDCVGLGTCCEDGTHNCVGNAGGGGAGGSVNPGCVPSALPAGSPLPDSCSGVFVSGSTGNDATGDGTRGAPYASLGKAIAESAAAIYVCAEATADTATVTVPPGTSIFGAIDCATYRYSAATKSTLNPGMTTALVLAPGGGARIEDMHIEAVTATALGESSIAVLANATTSAALTRVELVAGDGADGQAGTSLLADSSLNGENGVIGNAALGAGTCNTTLNPGGNGGPKTCDGVVVDGGRGGGAIQDPGGLGQEGQQPTVATTGDGGIGQQIGAPAHSCNTQPAQPGVDGTPGPDGTGAPGPGTLSATGYTPALAQGAGPGTPGQGGGGGGASACTSGATGPSGGGGGSGGCPGAGGGAGTGAGSSFALLAFDATVTLTDCALTSGDGGNGGAGGNGQPGGAGGFGQNGGGAFACSGADGGNGGPGGSGGGGQGGHSAAVASTASANVTLTAPSFSLGAAGSGGPGGDAKPALDGAIGSAIDVLVL